MRLRIKFLPEQKKFKLPINLNSYIRRLIQSQFDSFSHACGQQNIIKEKNGAKYNAEFDCYTFSQLQIPHRYINGDTIVGERCEVSLYISSPSQRFIYCLMQAMSELDTVKIADTIFSVSELEILPQPKIASPAFFTCMSPIVVTHPTHLEYMQFALPQDFDLSENLAEIMRQRYEDCTGDTVPDAAITLQFDANYVLRRQGKITKLINLINPENASYLRVKGFLAPIILSGDSRLIQFAYEGGLGVMTADGFGMLESLGDTL
jgi:CRISPR-associated endoribonuclease Cas6